MSATSRAPSRRGWRPWRRRTEDRVLTEADVPWMVAPTASGVPMNAQVASRLLDVWACVRLLSETASTLPLVVYERQGGYRLRRDESPLALLLARPSPGATMANLIATVVAHMAVRGEAFVGKFRNETGAIEQLGPIPPDRVDVEVIGGEPFYRLSLDGSPGTVHTTADVLHIKLLSWDGVRGVSPLQQAREALGLAAATVETAAAMFGNQGIPRGVLAVRSQGPDGDEMRENLAAGIAARHGGPKNAGRVAVVDADAIAYHAVGLSPADAELLAHRRLSSTEIARLMRCPAALLDADTGSSLVYSNATQAADNLVRFSLQPYLTATEQAISADPDLCAPNEVVAYDLDQFLRPNATERAGIYTQGLQAGWLDVPTIRQQESLPPLSEEEAAAHASS